MKKLLFVSLMLLISSGFCLGQDAGKISGKVVFGGDRSPLHQVSVRIAQLNRSTVTDGDGNYSFSGIAPGKYTIIAHQEGFADLSSTVSYLNGALSPISGRYISSIKRQVTVTGSGTEETGQIVPSCKFRCKHDHLSSGRGSRSDRRRAGRFERSFGPGNSGL
jgi:hypothetical protein